MKTIEEHEEYLRLREKYVVIPIYGGNDNLPMETKDVLLRKALGDPEDCFHEVSVNESGEMKGRLPDFHRKVSVLEWDVLFNEGFIVGKLC